MYEESATYVRDPNLNELAQELGEILIFSSIEELKRYEDEASKNENVGATEMQEKINELSQKITETVNICLSHLNEIDNIRVIGQKLLSAKQYIHTIKAGYRCEDILKKKWEELEKRQKIER